MKSSVLRILSFRLCAGHLSVDKELACTIQLLK